MPIMSCEVAGKPGYKYGEQGRCYTYEPGHEESKNEAKRKAFLQAAAIKANDENKDKKE